jgi:hypothetical protein
MRRIMLMVTVALVMAAMMVAMAMPTLAQPWPRNATDGNSTYLHMGYCIKLSPTPEQCHPVKYK